MMNSNSIHPDALVFFGATWGPPEVESVAPPGGWSNPVVTA
jgi:hypothetical protein